MIPLTVTARLMTPPVLDRPVYLDGILLAGLGASVGGIDYEAVYAMPLPLARVETPAGWWWAASHVLPRGPESVGYTNRVPMVEEAARWTTARTLGIGAGPDKRLRIPYYTRPAMLTLRWTCVGDPEAVGRLLAHVPGIGRLTGHGHGWVVRWSVERGGPPLEAYRRDIGLRHLPAALTEGVQLPERVARRQIPLRPPYHRRRDAVPCWQVTP